MTLAPGAERSPGRMRGPRVGTPADPSAEGSLQVIPARMPDAWHVSEVASE